MTQTGLLTTSSFRGYNVLVTGGASGIGEAIVAFLARHGACVVVADINVAQGQKLVQQLRAQGYIVSFCQVDTTSSISLVSMLRSALATLPPTHPHFDSLICSAGVTGKPFDNVPSDNSKLSEGGDGAGNADALGSVLAALDGAVHATDVNLIGVLKAVQVVVKYGMGRSGSEAASSITPSRPGARSVTLISSLVSYRALPSTVDYSASKWGIRGAFRTLRQLLPSIGIRVNMIAPAFVRTPLLTVTSDKYEQLGVKFADIDDVVAAVASCVLENGCNGRARAITAGGTVDMEDDESGQGGERSMRELIGAGALGRFGAPLTHDECVALRDS